MRRYLAFLTLFFIILIGAISFFIDRHRVNHFIDQTENKYVLLNKAENLNGTISSLLSAKDILKNYQYISHLTLNDSIHKFIGVKSKSLEGFYLNDVLSVGQHLSKRPNSDTLFIISVNNQDTLRFILALP